MMSKKTILSTATTALAVESADRWLILASFLYLAVPHGLFAVQWLNWMAGLVYGTALVAGGVLLVRYLWSEPRLAATTESYWHWPLLAGVVVLVVGWTALSGIGGIGFQNSDWRAHNSVLRHLMEEDAPLVLVDRQGQLFYFVYYVAYYLPAAAIGRWLGWGAANAALFGWSVLGIVLALLWLVRLVRLKSPWRLGVAALVFAGFSGLDALGHYVMKGGWPALGGHIEWWGSLFQYSSQSTLLFWVPQHAVAAWLLTGVVMFFGLARLSVAVLGPLVAMSLLWTPFAAVGLALFIGLVIVSGMINEGWRAPFSASNLLVAPVIFAVSALFLLANTFNFPLEWIGEFSAKFMKRYSWFMGLEVLVFAVPALILVLTQNNNTTRSNKAKQRNKATQSNKKKQRNKTARSNKTKQRNKAAQDDQAAWNHQPTCILWLGLAMGILLMLPLIKMGFFNDLAMRGSIPALYVLMVFVARGVAEARGGWMWLPRGVLGVALLLGVWTGASEMRRSLAIYQTQPPELSQVSPFTMLGKGTVAQRRGDPHAFFYTYLAAK